MNDLEGGCQSALMAISGKQPDVLHIHDWQSASVAPLLKVGSEGGLKGREGSGGNRYKVTSWQLVRQAAGTHKIWTFATSGLHESRSPLRWGCPRLRASLHASLARRDVHGDECVNVLCAFCQKCALHAFCSN